MNVSIRKATEQDFEKVFSLIKEFSVFQKTPEKVAITPAQMIQDKDIFQCLIAVAGNENIIGFASYFFTYYSWSGKGLYLDDLYVGFAHKLTEAKFFTLEGIEYLSTFQSFLLQIFLEKIRDAEVHASLN